MFKFLITKIKLPLFFVAFSFMTFIPNTVFATTTTEATEIDKVMCNAYSIFTSGLGKTFAIFAIVALGIGFFLGKVSWGTAIAVAVGIGSIFGAPALVKTITGGEETVCVDSQ